jgi:putative ATP-binding cassette transporter
MKQDTAADSTRPKAGIRDHYGFIRRFVLFALPFWSAEHKWMNRGRLALIAALTVVQVAVQAGLNSWSARLYNAVEARQLDTFLEQIVTFVLLLLASVIVFAISLYVKRRLQFAWRVWLTKTTLSVWMAEGRHYQLGLIAGDHDNPDGRIAEDIRVTTESAVDLGHASTCCGGSPVSSMWKSAGRSFPYPASWSSSPLPILRSAPAWLYGRGFPWSAPPICGRRWKPISVSAWRVPGSIRKASP